jgi:hypothetical protein
MAYDAKKLSRQGGIPYAAGDSKSIYGYASADTLAAIAASGYFNSATKRLRKGDLIHVTASLGGTPEHTTLVVTSATGAATVTTSLEGTDALGVVGVAAGYKLARGVATITGSGTVVTGLATVVAIIATLGADASLTNGIAVTASIGDQAGTPAAGSAIVKVWKPTASGDVTPIASAAAVAVNWVAIGT